MVQGTVISVNNSEYLICIRPSCDCVRLKKKESFCFLKLNKNPTKESKLEYVKAELKNNQYYFTDINKNDFKWVGELKTIFTQRIIQKIATDVSRLGVDDSEWLRRQSKKYFP